ncbi:MAG: cell division protein FtsW [Deltaproteobacteria bacterium]|nr:cell division protein FtsW [Deltaproteobacteria bacterium]
MRAGFFTFQPSEVAKLMLVIYLAYSLSQKVDRIKTFSIGFLPHIIISGLIILLILKEPDFGTAVVLGGITIFMMYIAGVRFTYLVTLFLITLPFIYLMITQVGYRMNRIMAFLNPWKDPEGGGFQIVQSLLAFGAGGIWGVGLGEGRQKLLYLPEAHSDFILSVVGEELGLLGVSTILILYLFFLICGIRIALKAGDLFGSYLALGITLLITLQAIVNTGVVMGLLPPKGLALPFISYGGTSLVVNMVGVGILLNIFIKGSEG